MLPALREKSKTQLYIKSCEAKTKIKESNEELVKHPINSTLTKKHKKGKTYFV